MENLKALAYELRKGTLDIIVSGGSGHIGGDMSRMEVLTELYFREMNVSPDMADDPNRDYFILSKGHSMEAYFAVLCRKDFMSGAMYKLDNLCAVIDRNMLQISGGTEEVMAEGDLSAKLAAFGWNVINVADGNSIDELHTAFETAKSVSGNPAAIIVHTTKGKGSPVMENRAGWHHKVPNESEYAEIMRDLDAAIAALS